MKMEKTASGSKKITIARKEWEAIGVKSGWMKTAQPAPQQPAPQQPGTQQPGTQQPGTQQALVPFRTALAQHPDLAKAFESVRTGVPFLKKLLQQYNVDWQSDPNALEVLG